MARPRQKRKNKSSLPRIRQRSKAHPPPIKSNAIVAANWDAALTLRQNYKNLGLTSRLNASTGGVEKRYRKGENGAEGRDGLTTFKGRRKEELEVGSVKVVRDEATGKIERVVRDDGEEERRRRENPLNDPIDALDLERRFEGSENLGGIVPQLEESARFEKMRRPRQMSRREREWVKELVEAHGADFAAMWRDRRRNPMQQSESDIKRRVEKLRMEEGVDMGIEIAGV